MTNTEIKKELYKQKPEATLRYIRKGVAHYYADLEQQRVHIIYFQPKGIRPQYCEAGIIHESDPEHIWCLNEPCKILISEVKIIPKENVTYDKKSRLYLVQQSSL
jgi:hypothetical protein